MTTTVFPRVHELLQHIHKPVHIGNVQAGRRLVEDIDGLAGRASGQLGRELGALRFAARKRRGGLTELDVAETDLAHGLQTRAIFGTFAKNSHASSTVMSSTS